MTKKLFTVNQAANYLKVTDSVVKEMIKGNVFNSIKKGNTQYIEVAEVEEWLNNLNEREVEKLALQRSVCRFSDYFSPKNIYLDFHAENKYEAIAAMSKKAKELKLVKDHRWLYQVVVAREELVSTAIGKGVALLHPRHFHPNKVKKPSILFGRSSDEIEFDALDNQPVDIFFMLLLHNDMQHLFSISYISKFLMKEANLNILKNSQNKDEIVKALTDKVLDK